MSTQPDLSIGSSVTVKVQGEIVTATYQGWSDKYNLAIVDVDGQRMYRKLQGGTTSRRPSNVIPMKKSRFDINTRFDFIEEVVDMVIAGE